MKCRRCDHPSDKENPVIEDYCGPCRLIMLKVVYISEAIEKFKDNRTRTSQYLGYSIKTLRNHIAKIPELNKYKKKVLIKPKSIVKTNEKEESMKIEKRKWHHFSKKTKTSEKDWKAKFVESKLVHFKNTHTFRQMSPGEQKKAVTRFTALMY